MQASCQCGALTAAIADGAEPMTIMCHCVDCQRRSGAPFGTISYFPKDAVTVAGEVREFTRPTDLGFTFTTGFCPTCGSTVYARASRMPDVTGVPVGAFADPDHGMPIRSVYEQSKHWWVPMHEEMSHHPRGRDTSW